MSLVHTRPSMADDRMDDFRKSDVGLLDVLVEALNSGGWPCELAGGGTEMRKTFFLMCARVNETILYFSGEAKWVVGAA